MKISENVLTIWKDITKVIVKVPSVWKEVSDAYINVGGTWKQFYSSGFIPANMIAFADTTVLNGWSELSILISKYAMVNNVDGGAAGADTHTPDSILTTLEAEGVGSTGIGMDPGAGHTHSFTHGHSSVTNNPYHIVLRPLVSTLDAPIKDNMLFFFDSDVIPDGWQDMTATHNGAFIKCDSTPNLTPSGSNSHTHTHTGSSSSETPAGANVGSGGQSVISQVTHSHTVNHTHNSDNTPPFYEMRLIKLQASGEATEVPSGLCAFFNTDIVPNGWSYFSETLGRFIQIGSNRGTTGGSLTHNDMFSGYSGYYTDPSPMSVAVGGESVHLEMHAHPINHGHYSMYHTPGHRKLLFCKKD